MPVVGLRFVLRDQAAGISVQTPGTAVAENLALNNYPAATAAAQTKSAWLHSPEHKANIMATQVASTGIGAVCCFVGSVSDQHLTLAEGVWVYVQEFSGGPGAVLPVATTSPAPAVACQYVLGFQTLEGLAAADTGSCTGNQTFAANCDGLQHTTHGLLVWRKADNFTAFTDGYRMWVNGSARPAKRLNSQRFSWGANPGGLPVVP